MSTAVDNEIGKARQHSATAVSITFVVVAAFFLVLRYIARSTRGIGLRSDDWMEVVSFVLLLCLLTCSLLLIHRGSGLPMNSLSYSELETWLKIVMTVECFYVTTILAIKTSLLLMYNRMFPTRQIRNASIVLWSISCMLTLATIFASVFQCAPIEKAWNPLIPGHCSSTRALLIYSALPNVLTDFAILFLPIRLVWNLEIRLNQKYILILIFMSGFLFIIGSVSRFIILFGYRKDDTLRTTLSPTTWGLIEGSAGIITGCIPTLIPLIQPIAAFFFSHFQPKEVDEIIGAQDKLPGHPHSISHFSIDSKKSKGTYKKQSGGRHFRKLSSTSGKNGKTTSNVLPLEVRVTTTIEVISYILSNDGPVSSRHRTLQEEEEEGVEMVGFKHEYGPKNMSGWV